MGMGLESARRTDERWTVGVLNSHPLDVVRRRPQVRWADDVRELDGKQWKSVP